MYGNLLNSVDRGRHNPTEKILWLAEHLSERVWTLILGVFVQSPASYELEVCDIYVAYVYGYNKGPSRNFVWYSFGGSR